MKNTTNKINLSRLQVCPFGHKEPLYYDYKGFDFFDNRNHYVVNSQTEFLGVVVSFSVEDEITFSEIRNTQLQINLYNVSENRLISCQTIRNIIACKNYRFDFPFEYDEINTDAAYKVEVFNPVTNKVLGNKHFYLYDSDKINVSPAQWYSVLSGCIVAKRMEGGKDHYRSYFGLNNKWCGIHFSIRPNIERCSRLPLPELEVRVYYPDGSVKTSFCGVRQNKRLKNKEFVYMKFNIGAYSNDEYFYAEILCMGIRISGFVFNTGSYEIGEWSNGELSYIVGYNPEKSDGFKYLMRQNNDSGWKLFDSDHNVYISPDEDIDADDNAEDDSESFETDDELSNESYKVSWKKDRGATDAPENKRGEDLNAQYENAKKQLEEMVGLASVKAKLLVFEKIVMFNAMRAKENLPAMSTSLHTMFLGSPGTGKTTVAKFMGLLLAKIGVLSRGHVVVKERASLLGQYYNSESEKTMEAIEEAQGGILLIDEAYQLYQPNDPRDPGKFVIGTLLTALADHTNRDWMLILCGYPEPMKKLFEMNPGFKSRIPESNIFTFDDYNSEELLEIAERYLRSNEYNLTDEARTSLSEKITYDYEHRNDKFGNARYVTNLIETEILQNMAVRVSSMTNTTPADLSLILTEDIPAITEINTPVRKSVGFR